MSWFLPQIICWVPECVMVSEFSKWHGVSFLGILQLGVLSQRDCDVGPPLAGNGLMLIVWYPGVVLTRYPFADR